MLYLYENNLIMEKKVIISLGEYENLVNSDKIRKEEIAVLEKQYNEAINKLTESRYFISVDPREDGCGLWSHPSGYFSARWTGLKYYKPSTVNETDNFISELIRSNNNIFERLGKELNLASDNCSRLEKETRMLHFDYNKLKELRKPWYKKLF